MNRGDLYRVAHPSTRDPKRSRIFVVVSRQLLIDSQFSTVVSAPIYSKYHGFSTQVHVDVADGLKHSSSIHCDELVSLHKSVLTDYIGKLSVLKLAELNVALKVALSIE
ncbi:type II toxin-antitoxin system PemK/MazF family toxin [Methylocucumis oryzae]|uniref:MazF family transcriptional regulator n=1 Tax=Methylocucumis oryzae TaxID=1632867 RepID=A0A0F3IEQ0_9GAMM|nr:type II toxin-antitoxin system PemK/MazF family toxin [Methylocucumis oryzae]KJV05142.1 MazF family transcriptional regulator [Methylocucumis oryzae]